MTQELPEQRGALTFVAVPCVQRIALATGVSEVRIDGHLHCVASGSVRPFREALRSNEVISLESTLTHSSEERSPR